MGNRRKSPNGFTLIELSIVLGIAALILALEMPAITRMLARGADPYANLKLWFDLVCERSLFRREGFLVEIAPREGELRLVLPVVRGEGELEWQEVSDPFLPTRTQLPKDVRILDIQHISGEKVSDLKTLIKVLPSGWIDPFTLHLEERGKSGSTERTGFMNPFTCTLNWEEGYKERFYEPR